MFPKIVVPQNGWFIMVPTLLKWMIWGAHPYFWFNTHIPSVPPCNSEGGFQPISTSKVEVVCNPTARIVEGQDASATTSRDVRVFPLDRDDTADG